MGSLEQAITQLQQEIEDYIKQGNDPLVCYRISAPNIDLLSWLKAQETYPQYYFNFRDEPKKIAALGHIITFFDLNDAQLFEEETGLPILGGLQFQGYTQFVLPQLFLEQSEDGTKISALVYGENVAKSTLKLLKTLTKSTALCALPKQIPQQIKYRADEKTWENWVNQGLVAIKEGKLSKLVLANETTFHLEHAVNPYDFLAESEKQNQGCYHFLCSERPNHAFVGSTPERLFARDGDVFLTEALAGTAPITENSAENQKLADWLCHDEKNLNENQLVVQDISENLNGLVESFDVGRLELKPLRKVQHLLRKIRANLTAPYHDAQLLKAIHPTAAVAGLPKQQAKDAIGKIECFHREWYAAAFGIMGKNRSEFCVAIRSAMIDEKTIQVFAGAGIVEGSNPSEEWKEIERKAAGLISLFAENNNGEKECL